MNKLNQLTAEIVYWATGRTKIYPEKDFAGNYRRITSSFEKKEKFKKQNHPIQRNTEK
tara:strand:- start:608 stop:781 length:174 start_codon:yes stop_codon:yes gene_type:complete